jgi:hypothetical protein
VSSLITTSLLCLGAVTEQRARAAVSVEFHINRVSWLWKAQLSPSQKVLAPQAQTVENDKLYKSVGQAPGLAVPQARLGWPESPAPWLPDHRLCSPAYLSLNAATQLEQTWPYQMASLCDHFSFILLDPLGQFIVPSAGPLLGPLPPLQLQCTPRKVSVYSQADVVYREGREQSAVLWRLGSCSLTQSPHNRRWCKGGNKKAPINKSGWVSSCIFLMDWKHLLVVSGTKFCVAEGTISCKCRGSTNYSHSIVS